MAQTWNLAITLTGYPAGLGLEAAQRDGPPGRRDLLFDRARVVLNAAALSHNDHVAEPFPPDSDGTVVSDRLAQVLMVYADPANSSGLDDLHVAVRRGRYSWLEHELAQCLREEAFTVQQWAHSTGQAGTALTPALMAKQQQRLWHTVFAAKEYPVGLG